MNLIIIFDDVIDDEGVMRKSKLDLYLGSERCDGPLLTLAYNNKRISS